MKQRITTEELNTLNIDQMEKLRYMWHPKKYDLVCSKICKDAEKDIYEYIKFVVGKVQVEDVSVYSRGCQVSLFDICSLSSYEAEEETDEENEGEPSEVNEDNDNDDAEDTLIEEDKKGVSLENELEEGSEKLSFELENTRPSIFSLDDCLPLLSIGGMIELLIKKNYDINNFDMDIIEDEYIFSKKSDNYNDYDENVKSNELCDVLWKAVCDIL